MQAIDQDFGNNESSLRMIWRGYINGMSFCDYAHVAHELKSGDELYLTRQPGNSFDRKAIAVLYHQKFNTFQVGWIPKEQNEMLARLMDIGCQLRARCIIHDTNSAWNTRILVGIWMQLWKDTEVQSKSRVKRVAEQKKTKTASGSRATLYMQHADGHGYVDIGELRLADGFRIEG